jgi:hypothetical protein
MLRVRAKRGMRIPLGALCGDRCPLLNNASQIPLPTKDGDRNLACMLKEIRSKLDAQKANLPPDDRLFFDKAYSFLQSFKNPLRNNTMHVDAVYDQISARAVYGALSGFMRHAATRLKE